MSRRSSTRSTSSKRKGSVESAFSDSMEKGRSNSAARRRQRADKDARWTYAAVTAGASMLLLVTKDSSLQTNFGALAGPVALFSAMDAASSRLRKPFRSHVETGLVSAAFAMAAAGLAGVRFGHWDLIALNVAGAFLSGFCRVMREHHQVHTGETLEMLGLFQGVFCGVFTSFSGLAIAAATDSRGLGHGLAYYLLTLVLGALATEAGMRSGGQIGEALLMHDRYEERVKYAVNWAPFVAAYLATWSMLAAPSALRPQLASSYLFSFLGVELGNAVDVLEDTLIQDFASNALAVLLATTALQGCSSRFMRRPGRAPLIPCGTLVESEFESSFCGAVSSFCGSAAAVHGLFRALLPEDVAEDLYLNHKLVGSNAMRAVLGAVETSQRPRETLRHAVRILADLGLVLSVAVVAKLQA